MDLTIGVASLDTRSERRNNIMKSSDFFYAEKYPVIRFKSTKIMKMKDDRYEITGDFSLHGVKKSMKLVFELLQDQDVQIDGRQLVLKTQFVIKRRDYGMTRDIPIIGDKVKISLVLDAR